MDPLLPAETEAMEREADKDERRKIQFSVPSSVPTQLDPRQVEMIRRRRPTPATLFRLTDPPSPEEDCSPHQWVLGENGALRAKLVHASTYQPPSLKGISLQAAQIMRTKCVMTAAYFIFGTPSNITNINYNFISINNMYKEEEAVSAQSYLALWYQNRSVG
uniref:Protein phosphatase 1 regulatory subunit 1B n=1 Tax=Scophthalmus maximus TaxID=52904 RepID=A0A8D3D3A7_SCOMX